MLRNCDAYNEQLPGGRRSLFSKNRGYLVTCYNLKEISMCEDFHFLPNIMVCFMGSSEI